MKVHEQGLLTKTVNIGLPRTIITIQLTIILQYISWHIFVHVLILEIKNKEC